MRANRREVLGAGAALGAAGGARGASRPFDYSSPEDNMRAAVKLMGALDGQVTYLHAQGKLFGWRPGQHARPLLDWEGCAARRFVQTADGTFDYWIREWLLFRDAATGAVLDRWENPYTRETVTLPHFRGGGANLVYRWTTRGQERIANPELTQPHGPLVYDWRFDGDQAIATVDQYVAFPNFQQPDRFPVESTGPVRWELQFRTFIARRADLENPRLASAPCKEMFVMRNDWMGFMRMGQWSGGHLWRAHGEKLGRVEHLPARFRVDTERKWPGLIDETIAWSRR